MESAFTISPSISAANSRARADLPEAVGPATSQTRTGGGTGSTWPTRVILHALALAARVPALRLGAVRVARLSKAQRSCISSKKRRQLLRTAQDAVGSNIQWCTFPPFRRKLNG